MNEIIAIKYYRVCYFDLGHCQLNKSFSKECSTIIYIHFLKLCLNYLCNYICPVNYFLEANRRIGIHLDCLYFI